MRQKPFFLVASLVVGMGCFLSPSPTHAALHFRVNVDTTLLVSHPAAPFSLDFQLNDGSGTGDANNTALLSNFLFGSGSASGSPTTAGGASGSLGTSVVLTDSAFRNELFQSFIPSRTLQFDVLLTTNLDASFPDQFSFAILDNTLTEIPTTGFANTLVLINIDTVTPSIQAFPGDPTFPPAAGGNGIALPTPRITLLGAVPEPGTTALLFASSFSGTSFLLRRRRAVIR